MGDIAKISGLTFAAVEILKQAGLPSRYAGIAAILVGIVIASIDGHSRGEPATQAGTWITSGFMAGLAAAGMYSAPKAATTLPARNAKGQFARRDGAA